MPPLDEHDGAPAAASRRDRAPHPADGEVARDFAGIGRRWGAWVRPTITEDVVVELDRAVASWHPAVGRALVAARRTLREGIAERLERERAAAIASDPQARDAVAPAPWRRGMRALAMLGALAPTTFAIVGVLHALGHRRAPDPTDLAAVAAVGAVVALAAHLAALLPPARAGVPSRTTSFLLEASTLGAAGATLVMAGPAADSQATLLAAIATGASATGLALVTAAVLAARLRLPPAQRRAHVDAVARIETLVPTMLAERLGAARADVAAAWAALHPDTRAAIDRERREAVLALVARRIRVDVDAVLASPPGVAQLPADADAAWFALDAPSAHAAAQRFAPRRGSLVEAFAQGRIPPAR